MRLLTFGLTLILADCLGGGNGGPWLPSECPGDSGAASSPAGTASTSPACGGGSGTGSPNPSASGNPGCNTFSGIVSGSIGSSLGCPSAPASAPGSGIDLSIWKLQEPIGPPGDPITITSAQLMAGYSDAYFKSSGGSLTFYCPTTGVMTSGSTHPRTELRELQDWGLTGTNTLAVTVTATSISGKTAIGQVHTAGTSPWVELFYDGNAVWIQISTSTAKGSGVQYPPITTVPTGTAITYQIQVTSTTVSLSVNGASKSWPVTSAFTSLQYYFKAGDYVQYGSGTGPTLVFSALSVTHQ